MSNYKETSALYNEFLSYLPEGILDEVEKKFQKENKYLLNMLAKFEREHSKFQVYRDKFFEEAEKAVRELKNLYPNHPVYAYVYHGFYLNSFEQPKLIMKLKEDILHRIVKEKGYEELLNSYLSANELLKTSSTKPQVKKAVNIIRKAGWKLELEEQENDIAKAIFKSEIPSLPKQEKK